MGTEYKTTSLNAFEIYEKQKTMSNKQIAAAFGVNLFTFYTWCYRHNVITKRLTDFEIAEEIGTKTVKEIAYEHNVSTITIYRRLSKMGICPKQPGQAGGRK